MPTPVENLVTIRANYIQALATESAYQVTNGPKPSYSIDGESVQWDSWRDSMTSKITELTELIQKLGGPVMVRSRGRS